MVLAQPVSVGFWRSKPSAWVFVAQWVLCFNFPADAPRFLPFVARFVFVVQKNRLAPALQKIVALVADRVFDRCGWVAAALVVRSFAGLRPLVVVVVSSLGSLFLLRVLFFSKTCLGAADPAGRFAICFFSKLSKFLKLDIPSF